MGAIVTPRIVENRMHLGGGNLYPMEGGIDRVEILIKAVDLQELTREILLDFFRERHQTCSADAVENALDGVLPQDASLKKSARLLFLAGLIDRDVRDDLVAIDRIRDAYAHKKGLGQIDQTPEIQRLLRDMEGRKQNNAALAVLPTDRHRFYAIVDAIEEYLRQTLTGRGVVRR